MVEIDNSQLIQARKRLHSFLLPNLIGLDAFDEEDSTIKVLLGAKSVKKTDMSRSSLRLTREVAPEIDEVISRVCDRLHIPRVLVDVFVFPGAEISGFCIVNELPIIVGLSSAVINTLDSDELAFVLGHEIGHALFKETSNFIANSSCLEDQIIARSIEICVDRVGLLASNNQDATFRAILKTLSGLDERHLRFDFSHFMSESREFGDSVISNQMLYSSHPPLPQRFRALVSFSMSDVYHELSGKGALGAIPIEQVNSLVQSGLNNAVDKKAHEIINLSIQNLLTWLASFLVSSKLTINLQQIKTIFGVELTKEDIQRAVIFLEGYSEHERPIVVGEKIKEALIDSSKVAPRLTSKILKKVKEIYPEFTLHIQQMPNVFSA